MATVKIDGLSPDCEYDNVNGALEITRRLSDKVLAAGKSMSRRSCGMSCRSPSPGVRVAINARVTMPWSMPISG